MFGSPGQTRTADKVINSHLLYQLSYRGLGGRILLIVFHLVKGICDFFCNFSFIYLQRYCASLAEAILARPLMDKTTAFDVVGWFVEHNLNDPLGHAEPFALK